MTHSDRTMLAGCLCAAFLAMISLSAAAPATHAPEIANAALAYQPVQLARVHSLTAVSMRAVSLY